MVLTSNSVPDRQFTLKASVRGLLLIIRGNPGITGDSDADKFTENLCTEVPGEEFSATLLVAGKWIRCSASPSVDKNYMNTKPCSGNRNLTACSVASTHSSEQQWNLVTPQEETLLPRLGEGNVKSYSWENSHHQTTMKSALVILSISCCFSLVSLLPFSFLPIFVKSQEKRNITLAGRHSLEVSSLPMTFLCKGLIFYKSLFSFSGPVFHSWCYLRVEFTWLKSSMVDLPIVISNFKDSYLFLLDTISIM